MNEMLLVENFDRLIDAPDAFSLLRKFFLDLAVRGKLVPSNDSETAAELLSEIRNSGIISRLELEKLTGQETKFDRHYDLPTSWAWAYLGEVAQYGSSEKISPGDVTTEDTWVLDLEDIEKDTSRLLARVESKDRKFNSAKTVFKKGDVLFGKLRPYLNKVIIADRDGICTTEIVPIRPHPGMQSGYLQIVLRSPIVMSQVQVMMYGMKMPRLGTSDAKALRIPIPPLSEQKLIIREFDRLADLCTKLEQAKNNSNYKRERLFSSCIQRISRENYSQANNAAIIFDIDQIFQHAKTIADVQLMRATFIDLAIQGRLATQNSGDVSSVVLLAKAHNEIAQYQSRLGVKGTPPIAVDPEDVPFAVPPGWTWTTLASVCRIVTDGDHMPPPKTNNGVAFLTIGNISGGVIDFSDCRYVSQEYFDSILEFRRPVYGDILYTVVGATYGRPVLVKTDIDFCVQRHIAILKPSQNMKVEYLHLALRSSLIFDQATRSLTGIAQPTVPLRPLRNFILPIPPLAEQQRIVDRFSDMMKLCDELERRILDQQNTSRSILEGLTGTSLSNGSDASPVDELVDAIEIPKPERSVWKDSNFMSSNPVTTIEQMVQCIVDIGNDVDSISLLKHTGLEDDIESFYDLLRAARDSEKVIVSLGSNEVISASGK
jgi:type I restriction enzyme S subunit